MVIGLAVIGGTGNSMIGTLLVMLSCCALALCVGPAATSVHGLRGWRRVGANVAMNVLAALVLAATSAPHLVATVQQVLIECGCGWLNAICCLF